MAIFDVLGNLCGETTSGGQLITSSAASEDIFDWGAADREMGAGEPLYLNIRVGSADFGGQGSTTIVFAVVYDTVAPVDGSSIVIYQTPAIDEGVLVAGYWVLRMPLPVNVDEERILGIYMTVGSGPMTGGAINAWIDHGPPSSHDTQVTDSPITKGP